MPKRYLDSQAINVDEAGSISVNVETNPDTKTTVLDYDGSNNLIYSGLASPGSSKAVAVWQIKKYTYDGSSNLTDIQYADGNLEYDNIWNNRASGSYS